MRRVQMSSWLTAEKDQASGSTNEDSSAHLQIKGKVLAVTKELILASINNELTLMTPLRKARSQISVTT